MFFKIVLENSFSKHKGTQFWCSLKVIVVSKFCVFRVFHSEKTIRTNRILCIFLILIVCEDLKLVWFLFFKTVFENSFLNMVFSEISLYRSLIRV